jgi:hypothetical protein
MIFVNRIAGVAALGAAMLIGSGPCAPPAQAGYIVTLAQQGSNVVATGSGTLDLTDLSLEMSALDVTAAMLPGEGIIRTGPVFLPPDEHVFIDRYTGLTGPTSFGSNMLAIFANSGNGDEVGISGISHELDVPAGHLVGPLSDSSTYDNATFSSLGVTPGTYVWTWGSGANQNFTLVIGTAAVPEPSSLLLLVVRARRAAACWYR